MSSIENWIQLFLWALVLYQQVVIRRMRKTAEAETDSLRELRNAVIEVGNRLTAKDGKFTKVL